MLLADDDFEESFLYKPKMKSVATVPEDVTVTRKKPSSSARDQQLSAKLPIHTDPAPDEQAIVSNVK